MRVPGADEIGPLEVAHPDDHVVLSGRSQGAAAVFTGSDAADCPVGCVPAAR